MFLMKYTIVEVTVIILHSKVFTTAVKVLFHNIFVSDVCVGVCGSWVML